MKTLHKIILAIMIVALVGFAPQARATIVNFTIGVDDYVALTIAGTPIASYDAYPAGAVSGSFDMTPGTWYDITINYKNRWGSNGLQFYWDQPGDVGGLISGGAIEIVPELNLRTPDGAGGYISGLHADYYDLNGNFQFAVDGEGPIAAGNANGTTFYENQLGLWAGTYTYWGTFEEVLTGQIQTTAAIPEPATIWIWLLGSGLVCLFVFVRKRNAA